MIWRYVKIRSGRCELCVSMTHCLSGTRCALAANMSWIAKERQFGRSLQNISLASSPPRNPLQSKSQVGSGIRACCCMLKEANRSCTSYTCSKWIGWLRPKIHDTISKNLGRAIIPGSGFQSKVWLTHLRCRLLTSAGAPLDWSEDLQCECHASDYAHGLEPGSNTSTSFYGKAATAQAWHQERIVKVVFFECD